MGQFKTIVVIEQNYLIQAGLESVMGELPGFVFLKAYSGKEKNLMGLLIKHNPDVIIVNPLMLEQPVATFLNRLKEKTSSVVFGITDISSPEKIKSPFSHLLYFSDNKLELQKKIKLVIEPAKQQQQRVLSEREITILKHVALGLTNQEIADLLFISVHTVTTHRKNIIKKLGIKTISGLTVYALMNQLVSMEEMENKV